MEFRLSTFGLLRLEAAGETVVGPAGQRRRLALLALLAAGGERGLTREKLLGLLWPEQMETRGRHLLSESLYVIRRALADEVIVASGDEIRLNPDLVASDVAEFRQAIAQDRLEEAVGLYRGPFLDGFYLKDTQPFEEWVERERQELARELARVLEELALRAGDVEAAADWWHRLAAHEPYSSRIALRYMDALAARGDPAHAVQYATQHVTRLREELGVEPDAEVMRLAERLATDSGPDASETDTDDADTGFASEFEIVRVLGVGSVARVYLAREGALKRMVAIKALLPEHAAVETVRLRFERDAQSAARIQHPNVVTAFRFGRLDDGAPCIVLPYIDGGSLEDRLAASGAIPVAQALKHIAQLASALATAHKLGIVHRDVRPANILIDRATDRMMLTDFGLAAVLDASADSLRLTRPGEALGNVRYASPEQLRAEPVTERADVYSLGIVAFEMLAGRLPYDASSPIELMVAHDSAQPRKLREFVPAIDRKVEALLQRCLMKRPEQRPFAEELIGLM